MTLAEFADKNPALAEETPVDQVLAIAWYWRTHDPTHVLCYSEMHDAFRELGLDSSKVAAAFSELTTKEPKQFILLNYPGDYRLSMAAMNRLNVKYANSKERQQTAQEAASSFAFTQAERVADALSSSYIIQQLARMETAIEQDAELAIGTAKEFIESVCKTVLARKSVTLTGSEKLTSLARLTLKELKLMSQDASDGSEATRSLLGSLSTIPHQLAELRNRHGSGHGKNADAAALGIPYARLAVGAAITFGVFIWDADESERNGT